ncbi:MAG: D-glycero-beta-D-manno-heptose 1,7-bisphosphate 7-phosphatase [Thermodesulfobacteriota bacterium]|nr:D-glycero-beta-D-manno-heptose 1,7-bisphosphate 7-phosphatase [Thermodesulfobacteriota bacterium]
MWTATNGLNNILFLQNLKESRKIEALKTVFLDRDGVINRDRTDYVKSWSDFEFLPRSLNALRLLSLHGYRVIVITNQSVINRNMVTKAGLEKIHDKMRAAVAAYGGHIEAVYYCPHVPEDGCHCRKPEPGLIFQAQADYGCDLAATCVVGDSLKDIQCARRARCGKALLVRTGHGAQTERLCQKGEVTPDYVADDLMAAAEWLLGPGST